MFSNLMRQIQPRSFLFYVELACIMFFAVATQAQELQFVNYTVVDGLPQSQVHAILQDQKGYIWFGTAGGVARFDGVQVKSWDKTNGLAQIDYIFTMLEDRQGNIWLGTLGGGLARITDSPSGFQIKVFTDADGFLWDYIYSSYEDQNGILWFGVDSATVVRFDGYQFSEQQLAKRERNAYIRAISEDHEGNLLFSAYEEGFFRKRKDQVEHFGVEDGLPDGRINAFAVDAEDNLWIAGKGGLSKCRQDKNGNYEFINYSTDDGLPSRSIYSMAIDKNECLWLGTRKGLTAFQHGEFRVYNQGNGLINDRVLSVAIDREEILWLGTVGGVSKLSQTMFERFTTEHGLSGNYITAIYTDRDDRMWIGTNGHGITVRDNGRFHPHAVDDTLKDAIVRAIYQDDNGIMWFGTRSGLVKKAADKITIYGESDGLDGVYIRDIVQDSTGRIWLATERGVWSFMPDAQKPEFQSLNRLYGMEELSAWDILQDRKNNLWLQTRAGVYRYDGIHCTRVQNISIRQGTVAIEASNGDIWVGSREGVVRYAGETMEAFTKENGLSHNSVWAITEDTNQNIWFGTTKGIDRYDGTTWRNYHSHDGLAGNEVSIHSMLVDKDENLWIGTNLGLSKYDYRKDNLSTIPPIVHITQINAGERSFSPFEQVQLDYLRNDISFDFIGLWYKEETDLSYQYYLEGDEKTWNPITDRRYANYTNLNNGNYIFHVRAISGDSVWSENTAAFTFNVKQPFWESFWFFALCTMSFVVFILIMIRLRLEQIRLHSDMLEKKIGARTKELNRARIQAEEASRVKSEFLATMSHEIRTPMNGVIGMTDILLDTKLTGEQKEYALNVQNSAKALLTIINDILDFSKIEAGKVELECIEFDLKKTVNEVVDLLAVQAKAKSLIFECIFDPAIYTHVIGDPGRIRQILINLVSNAIKFTSQGEVMITVKPVHESPGEIKVKFMIKDTGIGIPHNRLKKLFQSFSQVDSSTTRKFGGTGLGLAISRRLVDLMDGRIGVSSKLHGGSTFWFTVVLQKQPLTSFAINEKVPLTVVENKHLGMAIEGSLKILLAEDNKINQKVAFKFLEKLGHQVYCVDNGKKAVMAVQQHFFDLVLMDCQMPELDGYDATREIRRQEKSSHIPIIALTANAMSGDREKCIASGMDDYLSKPLDPSELEKMIQCWCVKKVEKG
ncbi:MAG: response regulator [Calditrichaeota bacterium]|nr:MAG: response regulator [Calditrichota bacterium]